MTQPLPQSLEVFTLCPSPKSVDFFNTYIVNTVYEEFNGEDTRETKTRGTSTCSGFILSVPSKRGKCSRATGRRYVGRCHISTTTQRAQTSPLPRPDDAQTQVFSNYTKWRQSPEAPALPGKRQVTDPYGCWSEAQLTEPGAVAGTHPAAPTRG